MNSMSSMIGSYFDCLTWCHRTVLRKDNHIWTEHPITDQHRKLNNHSHSSWKVLIEYKASCRICSHWNVDKHCFWRAKFTVYHVIPWFITLRIIWDGPAIGNSMAMQDFLLFFFFYIWWHEAGTSIWMCIYTYRDIFLSL